jgi:hypothetical protein
MTASIARSPVATGLSIDQGRAAMTVGEFFGFLAALLTSITFYMKTMVPLRVVEILSNIAFR